MTDEPEIVIRNANGEVCYASGGWCAPSETIYQLPDTILTLPELQVVWGGIIHRRPE